MSHEEPQESPLSRMGGRVAGESRSEGENVGFRFQVEPNMAEAGAGGAQVAPNRAQAGAGSAGAGLNKAEAEAGSTQVAPNKAEAGTEGGASGGSRPTRARDFAKRPKPKERRRIGFFMPRLLPWSSPLSRVQPEVLILAWTLLTTFVLVWPKWPTLGIVALLLLLASIFGRVPLSAVPIPPIWFWSGLIGGMIGASIDGGILIFVRLIALSLVLLWGSALLLWTFSTARIAQALRRLISPLRFLGAPVDEWARIMGLALTAMPVLAEQSQAVVDAAKLRMGGEWTRMGLRSSLRLGVDVTTAVLSAASRSARDTGRAMSMRGGLDPLPQEPVRLGLNDGVAAVLSALALAGIVAAHVLVDLGGS